MYLNENISLVTLYLLGLTVTWDVFKYISVNFISNLFCRLTVTWDVFKWAGVLLKIESFWD